MTARNLIIIIDNLQVDHKDFEEIGQLILAKRANIHIYLFANDYDIANDPRVDWRLPTVTVSLCPRVKSEPRRGSVFFNRQIDKFVQIEAMHQAGITVPKSVIYDRATAYDAKDWGDFVIVKSRIIEGSSKGKSAYITPTKFLSDPAHFDDPVRTILSSGHGIIQEFVPTGPSPVDHRATVFLGRVLYLMQANSTVVLPELDPNSTTTHIYDTKFEDPERGIVRQRRLVDDREIIALAERIADVFPGVPLLGVDVLRHEKTGALYPLEINAGGNTWHFSSPSTVEGRKRISREQRIEQYGAWEIAADVLVEKTLSFAR